MFEYQKRKVVARSKRGSEYIIAERVPHSPQLTMVATVNSFPDTYLVNTENVIFEDV